MRTRSISLVLLQIVMTAAVGCSTERIVDPPLVPQGVFTTVQVPPSISILPGSKQLISVQAYDQRSWHMSWTLNDVTYSSSNPAIASVDNKGLLTAIAPGSVDVRTTLTINGVTLAAVTAVKVGTLPRAGTYRLVAPITEFYSPWGEYTCCSFTALITIKPGEGLPAGTFSNFIVIRPDGSAENRGGGDVRGIDYKGQLLVSLVSETTLWTGAVTESGPDTFVGNFNFGDETAKGSFTLTLVGG